MQPSAARDRKAVPVFAALGDAQRLSLVRHLSGHGPASLTQLCAGKSISRQAVSKHLHVLEGAGLVRGERRGRESIWELRPTPMVEASEALEVIARQWDAALGRLKNFVEER